MLQGVDEFVLPWECRVERRGYGGIYRTVGETCLEMILRSSGKHWKVQKSRQYQKLVNLGAVWYGRPKMELIKFC